MASVRFDVQVNVGSLQQAMERIQRGASPVPLRRAMERALALMIDWIAKYPPTRSGPGRYSLKTHKPMGYYERGRGWWYPVMRKQTLGETFTKSAGAQRAPRDLRGMVAGYKLIPSSETLGRKWTTRVDVLPNGVEGRIGNAASYAPHVQGSLQARLMAALGWRSITEFRSASWRDRIQRLLAAGVREAMQ